MEKIKIRNYEFLLKEYQVDTLLDILREFLKGNKELYSNIEKLKIMDPIRYNKLFNKEKK